MYEFKRKGSIINISELDFLNNINSERELINYNLINPIEIYDFFKENNDMESLIIETLGLIKKYFPNSKNYLEYVDDPEYENLSSLVIYVINKGKSFEENHEIYKLFLNDFYNLREFYPQIWKNIVILVKSNEEYCRKLLDSYNH